MCNASLKAVARTLNDSPKQIKRTNNFFSFQDENIQGLFLDHDR